MLQPNNLEDHITPNNRLKNLTNNLSNIFIDRKMLLNSNLTTPFAKSL